jgi:hypothetical protein
VNILLSGVAGILVLGCRSAPDTRYQPGIGGIISTQDRNGDGKVDREFHKFPGAGDMDWEFRDDDYDGVYEQLIRYGVGVFYEKVRIPVPFRAEPGGAANRSSR